MEKPISPVLPSERQHDVARAIDEAFHAQLATVNTGLPPIALTLAYANWALHLAASPGRQLLLAQQAVALSQQVLISPWHTIPPLMPMAGRCAKRLPASATRAGARGPSTP